MRRLAFLVSQSVSVTDEGSCVTDGRPAILAEGSEKSYDKTRLLDGLNLRAEEGTVR